MGVQVSCNGKCAWGRKVASYVCMFKVYVEDLEKFKVDMIDVESRIVVGLS